MGFIGVNLEPGQIEYLQSLVKSKRYANLSHALRGIIDDNKLRDCVNIKMPKKSLSVVHDIYNKFIPFVFGVIFMYFFAILKSWFFIPFLVIAVSPFIIPLDIDAENDLIKLVIPG